MKRVLIVGGGFAGLNAAKGLGGRHDVEVTVIDRRNYHLFQPLLYQVAMAGLSPAEIAVPIRSLLARDRNVQVLQEEVLELDLANRQAKTDLRQHAYDYLILACGAHHSYFGHEEWEEHAPGLKTIEQATEIRRRVLTAFEQAETENDPERRRQLLTFVIVGGGPTGVELAGAIGEMSRFTLAKDFRKIDPKLTRVLLIEAGPRILPTFSAEQSSRATRDLESLGVQVWTSSPVSRVDDSGVEIGKERIRCATVLWAAGVQASRLNQQLGLELDRQGRVRVRPDLSLEEHPEVFVLGDQAQCLDTSDGRPLPGLASVALQQGRHVAQNLCRELAGRPREDFRYLDKGQMATIGRSKAVVEIGSKLRFRGFFAWLIWIAVHIYYLTGFKNRFFVVVQWGMSYLTFRRGARLIVGKEWRSRAPKESSQGVGSP